MLVEITEESSRGQCRFHHHLADAGYEADCYYVVYVQDDWELEPPIYVMYVDSRDFSYDEIVETLEYGYNDPVELVMDLNVDTDNATFFHECSPREIFWLD